MRFIQQEAEKKPDKEKKEKEEPRILAGEKDYDYDNLHRTKKILTGRGKI